MKIDLLEVTVRDLTDGYEDSAEAGVKAYGGKLDVRPPFQREFVYKDKQRDAVIETAVRGFPLNVMYWATRADDTFEIIDGQQRTISLCQYVEGDFSVTRDGHRLAFYNLKDEQQRPLLDYKLTVYVCSGTEIEKLDWFRTINIAGERLTEQELRNAVYAGPWVSDARRYFSKTGCAASVLGQDYLSGSPLRQDLLETTLDWISGGGKEAIDEYMGRHQHDPKVGELWTYLQAVLAWVKATFPTTRPKLMKGLEWGHFYNQYKDTQLDPVHLEQEIKRLIADEEVGSQRGIYAYLLTGDERHLSLRTFSDQQKQRAFERQSGMCPKCGKMFELHEMDGDHIKPWHKGGKTVDGNLQMLCRKDNQSKSGK